LAIELGEDRGADGFVGLRRPRQLPRVQRDTCPASP
jgi:hypothetical protein